MRKIIKYEIARATLIKNLEWHVQHMVLNGWQPYGTITLFPYGDLYMLMQPMVMYAPEEGICEHEFVPVGSIKNGVQHAECRKCKFRS